MTDDGEHSRWLTYEDAAAALKIDAESVKRRAQRAGWPRRIGNDRRALVAVPEEVLREGETSGDKSPPDPMAAVVQQLIDNAMQARAELAEERQKRIALEAAMAVLIAEAKFLSRRGLAARLRRLADYRDLPPPPNPPG